MISKSLRFGKKRASLFENFVFSFVFVFIFASILGFFIFQNMKIANRRAHLSAELSQLRSKAGELAEKKEELQVKIAQTQTEDYQEKVLREQGLYKKQGEKVVTVLPPEKGTKEEIPSVEKKRTWWNPFTW